ncbi:dynactin subunit 4 [Biomphalaria glabrata]|uniref:Dynactin subunit 4 n=1 Tax=Biomphalaria glabrata TaxID=6526 RepID=A0A2C9LE73_BIOGL|nr:dynactin subunit 4-like [Biomphalaria glabrata]KAI8765672.1 dynactin subunit 4-like [Biomphalaria glabrata]KAI8797678.1 dynactin subunit 4 [Biomphalaria glabrata]
MATFATVDLVKYLCTCEKKFPICRLYLCKHCLKLRCIDCVQHEVDTPYCPNCLEIMPAQEAKLKKNRCSNCFDCPVCGHTLMTRASGHISPNPEDPNKSVTKKTYYLACGFCRWNTRDINMLDQTVATGNWPMLENPHVKRINNLLENYKLMAQVEKADRERKKYVKRRSHLYLQDKFNLSPSVMKRKGLSSFSSLSLKEGDKTIEDLEPSVPVESFDPLPNDYYTQPAALEKTTKLVHRLSVPEFQPEDVSKLHPINKHLIMKKSLRCRECEHNLSKSDFNPCSIKFKIQLTALHWVPEVRIMTPSTFTYNKETLVTLTMSNPSVFNTTVTLSQIENETDVDYCTAKVELPKKELVLASRDEPSMHVYEDSSQAHEFKDDPKLIVFRKGNKIGFVVKVTPVVPQGDVKICFLLKHEFRNTTVAALQSESKEPEIKWLEHKVYLCLGTI